NVAGRSPRRLRGGAVAERQHGAVFETGAAEFFSLLDTLVLSSEVVVDRPRGRAHPRIHEAIYPLDYGYLKGTRGGDGDGDRRQRDPVDG
ncbi:MAG: hypothetical protein ACLGI3_09775, partial [Actinomycetes bacterium]